MKSAEILRAMAYEIRLDIIKYVHVSGEVTVRDITNYCQLSQSAVSQHLAVLRKSGILKDRREKQKRYYSIACDLPVEIIKLMDKFELKQE